MGTAAEGLPLTINGVPLQDILEGAHVTDLFNCARIDALWEEAVLPILGRKLRFFALVQDRSGDATDDSKYVEELQSRLAVAKKVAKHPSFAIILCADKHYDSSAIARCFLDDVNVVQMDVQSPVTVQRRGVKGRWDASVCVLVFFGTPGVAFECEWSPYVECGVPASTAALFDTLKRSMPFYGSEDVHRHRSTGLPARFALYITSAFTTGVMFKRSPSLYGVGACVLWTPRVRVYHRASRESLPAQAYWGALSFGENLKTTCLKYAGWTTVLQLWTHLGSVRESLGDISDVMVLFFQEGELKHSVVETISLAFNDAAYVVGTACSLDLDSNPFTFGLEADGDTQTAICVQTPVIVLLVAIR